jgi:hypothetical protein
MDTEHFADRLADSRRGVTYHLQNEISRLRDELLAADSRAAQAEAVVAALRGLVDQAPDTPVAAIAVAKLREALEAPF